MATKSRLAAQPDEASNSRRAERFRVQRILWRHSSLKRVRLCGWAQNGTTDGFVGVRINTNGTRTAGFSGLQTCGSVHACPTCNAKIAAGRADDLAAAVNRWHERGGSVVLVTLTMRHRHDQRLSDLWEALSYAWSKATSGRGWATDVAAHGSYVAGKTRIPWARAVEATHGANGWHLHVHALVFLAGEVDADALGASMFQRWRDALMRKGLDAPVSHLGGLDVTHVGSASEAVGRYLAKSTWAHDAAGAGWEVAGGAMKDGRRGNRAPFAILRSFVETGDLDALDLWREWERASKGRRQLTWSRGLRDLLVLGSEASDEELAAAELDGETVALIDADSWKWLRHHKAELLAAAEVLPLDVLRGTPAAGWLTAAEWFSPPRVA